MLVWWWRFEIWHLSLHTSFNHTSHFTLHTSHFTLHTFLLELCYSLTFVFSHRNVTIPSPGYRHLQVSWFISKSRRKRPGNCPETKWYHSRRTRAVSLVLKARGTSRIHLWCMISVLGQPWIALIPRELNCDRLASVQATAQPLLYHFGSKEAGLVGHWSVEFGAGHWRRRLQTRKKKKHFLYGNILLSCI